MQKYYNVWCNIMCIIFNFSHKKSRRKKRAYIPGHHNTGFFNNVLLEKMMCRARYQQSPVEVFSKFVAIDQVNFFLWLISYLLHIVRFKYEQHNIYIYVCMVYGVCIYDSIYRNKNISYKMLVPCHSTE